MWVVLLIGICLVFVFPFTASSEPITMTFTTQNPENGWGQVMALKPWVEQVEKAAKGKLKIKVYYSQTLNKGPATWKAVKDGIADIGWGFHAYWRGMTSLSDVISLPSLPFNTSEEASGALWKLYEKFPQMREQYKDNHILLLYTTDPYFLITTKKQVKTLKNLNDGRSFHRDDEGARRGSCIRPHAGKLYGPSKGCYRRNGRPLGGDKLIQAL